MRKKWFPAGLAAVAFTAVVLTGNLLSAGVPVDRNAAPPNAVRLEPCVDLADLPSARCGSLIVPLDRQNPGAGTTTVAFALVPRTDQSRPALATITANPGGPGSSAIDLAGGAFGAALEPLLDRRDLLLVDPRGVGRSEQIRCAALENPAPYFGSLADQRQAIAECGHQLGATARHYTTEATADDLDDVREALGIPRLDLLGISYGTFLMAAYANRHPTHVSSIVLSGAYAVNSDSSEGNAATALRRAIKLVCERSGDCDGAQVVRDLSSLAARLRTDPITTKVTFHGATHRVVIDEWQLAGAVSRLFSKVPDTRAQLKLARTAASARAGDLGPVRALVRDHVTAQATDATMGPGMVSPALLWAVTCHDYPHEFGRSDSTDDRREDYDRHLSGMPRDDFQPFSPGAWAARAPFDTGACLGWPADRTAGTPFTRGATMPDVPVLVLSGDLDANTASRSGREAAAQFPTSTFVEIPGAGHTPAQSEQGLVKVLEFFARPGGS
jgi:pimeloyl-ACP methyl ester carboxylesterase